VRLVKIKGVSWQITPRVLTERWAGGEAKRAFDAIWQ